MIADGYHICIYLRFGAALSLFKAFGQLDDLHAQVGALAFNLQDKIGFLILFVIIP